MWTFTDGPDMYIITEYCSRGDLRKHINELQSLPEVERLDHIWELFAEISLALNFMHSNGAIHRDIKPENIFIMEDGSVRLGDFGLSKVIGENDYATFAGTRYYIAPESHMEGKMYFSSDVYSVGIVIYELLTGKHPFIGINDQETMENIIKGKAAKIPDFVPSDLKKLVSNMINSDFNKRPTIEMIMNNQTIKSIIQKIKEKEEIDDEQKEKELQATVLSAPKPISLDQLKTIKEEISSINKDFTPEIRIQKLKDGLSAVRSIQQLKDINITEEILQLSNDIVEITYSQKITEQLLLVMLLSQFYPKPKIDSALKKDEKQRDDEIEIIEDIFNLLLKENHETSQMIVDQKDFIEHQLIIFNSLPLNKIKSIYLYPLESLSKQDHKELNNKLFEMELKELKEGQKHPYHTQLSSDGVINKLIQMQHDKDKVDINYYIAQVIAYLFKAAALPPVNGKSIIDLLKVYRIKDLTFLAECKDNHDDILADDFEHQLFKDDDLQLLIEVSEEEKPQIKKMQEIEFKFLNEFLQNNEDDEMHKTIINSGIADALLSIFSTRDLDEITYTPFQTFFFFTWPYSAEISKLLIDKNPFPSLLRLFDHKDLDIINESINAMVNIMFGGTIGLDETSVHPYYEDLVQAGGIEKIYSLFKRNVSRQSQNSAAICLGIAFKSRIITDENM
ncbi:MAG: putative NEK protein kinase, partial [Streblomastix strix]